MGSTRASRSRYLLPIVSGGGLPWRLILCYRYGVLFVFLGLGNLYGSIKTRPKQKRKAGGSSSV